MWKTQIMGLIESQEMMGFLDGTYEKPDEYITSSTAGAAGEKILTESPQFCAWRKSDRLLRGWIIGTLSEEVLGLVVGLDTSAEVWNTLIDSYAYDSKEREFSLCQRLYHNKKNGKTMTEYLRIFKEICDDFAAIGKPVDDRQNFFQLLKGLGNGYEAFVTSMFKPPVPSYKEVISLLQSHETMRTLHDSETFGETNQHMAFMGQSSHWQDGGSNWKNRRENENGNGCRNGNWHENGHGNGNWRGNAHGNGRRNGNRGRNRRGYFNSRGRGFTQATQQNRGNHVSNSTIQEKDKVLVCQICDRYVHIAMDCYQRFNHTYHRDMPEAMAALSVSDALKDTWFPDTGASEHMTADDGKLTNSKPYFGPDKIMVGNGEKLKITHIGDAKVQVGSKDLTLQNVLVVPQIKKNLLSVSQLTSQFPYIFEFSSDGFVIKHRETQKEIASDSRSGGLYALDQYGGEIFFSNRFTVASDEVWHQRLRHPHYRVPTAMQTCIPPEQHYDLPSTCSLTFPLTGGEQVPEQGEASSNEQLDGAEQYSSPNPCAREAASNCGLEPEPNCNNDSTVLDTLMPREASQPTVTQAPTFSSIASSIVTRGKSGIQKPNPKYFSSDYAFLVQSIPTEPNDIKTALKHDDWGGCPLTRRSTTGYCTFLGGNCISWSAKNQPTVRRSSAEAEYRALASTAAEITWLSFILRDIGFPVSQPPTIFCDNIAALHLTINPMFHARTKHIELDYHFVREKVALESLTTCFVPSRHQVADIFTKPLAKSSYLNLRVKLGIWQPPLPSLRGSIKGLSSGTNSGESNPNQASQLSKNMGNNCSTKSAQSSPYEASQLSKNLGNNQFNSDSLD
ncbi:hypothetical protein RJ640_010678 [Escallonia rubra]|uniref:Retrovirus-related Pol polyprotein from transposon TNT 1-94-like beta-barrel domain-containing protein n=1 Tax=Escallonia rubra TaxID=112253 RepID=A0AA88UB75_9ASTE|nr:hypothetical protein RJ640_010678 [Escallonia rubra]